MPTVKRMDKSGERGKHGRNIKNRIANMEKLMKRTFNKK